MTTSIRLCAARALVVASALAAATVWTPVARASVYMVRATSDGWWNRFMGPQESEPSNPVRPLVPVVPSAPTVPADAIAVGLTAGQQDKVAAVGLSLGVGPDDAVLSLVLVLKESTASGSSSSPAQARVYGCPVTDAWPDGQRNGRWIDRPKAECSLGRVDGSRDAEGTWRFDLTSFGRLWASRSAGLDQNGVLLAIDPASGPGAFQVSFKDVHSGGVAVESRVARAQERPIPMPREEPVIVDETGAVVPADAALPSVAPAPVITQARPRGLVVARPAVAQEGGGPRQGDVLGNLPAGALLLVPLVAGLGLLVSYALGPGADPQPETRRRGSVSQTLAARARVD